LPFFNVIGNVIEFRKKHITFTLLLFKVIITKRMYYKIFSLSFKKVKAVNNEIDIRLLFKEKMCPALLNIRSQAAELAWTPRYFLAN